MNLRIKNILLIIALFLTVTASSYCSEASGETSKKILLLIKNFSDEDHFKAGEAIDSLVKIGGEAIDYLTESLKSLDDNIRICSSIALCKTAPGYIKIIPFLIDALKDKNAEVRWNAAIALGKFGKDADQATAALVNLLKDSDHEVRWASYVSLLKIKREAINLKPDLSGIIKTADTLVPALIKEYKVPGVSICIINNYEIKWSGTYGVGNSYTKTGVTQNSIFEACSMSKPLFAFLVMKLADEGNIDLDKPLRGYLDEQFISEDDGYSKLITARMILTHTSGMPNWRKGGEERGGALPIYFKPGSKFSYSGEGFYYLQRVVEKITNEPLEAFAKKTLFDKLDMKATGFITSDYILSNMTTGHDAEGKVIKPGNYKHADAAYTLYTTPDDYAKFIIEIMKTGRSNKSILSQKMVEEMLTHQVRSDVRDVVDRPGRSLGLFSFRGLGWGIDSTITGNIIYHSGANQTGFRCYSQFNISEGAGIVIMTNGLNGGELWSRLISVVGDL